MENQLAETIHERWRESASAGRTMREVAFEYLPEAWRQENIAAAQHALRVVQDGMVAGLTLEALAELVHDGWLARNKDRATAEQKVPYSELSEKEKEKDRAIVREATALLRSTAG